MSQELMSQELKSYGRIAYEAWESHDRCDKWSAASAAVRAAVIEREGFTEGWRLLEEGEVIWEGDQINFSGDMRHWTNTRSPGDTVENGVYRRRCLIAAPEPAASTIPPDTSTLAGKIAVMRKALEGKEIEFSNIHTVPCSFVLARNPQWDWMHYDYRVKPAPQPTPFEAYMATRHPNVERGSDDWQVFQDIWTAATEGRAE